MSVKRKYIKHGDIVEIQLPRLRKFSYGKIIEPKNIADPLDLPHFIRIYKDIYEHQISSINELSRELLLAPFYIAGGSAAITKFNWRIISNEEVTEEEEWIPDTKEGWPLFSSPPQRWGYKMRYGTELIFSKWENVQHLDYATGKNIEVIPFLIELEHLKIEGKDIQVEYNIDDWLEKTIYEKHIQLPVYSALPAELKGKAIG